MKLLQVCGPLLMAIILQLPLGLYELQGPVVCVDDRFLPQNVMLPLSASCTMEYILFVISGILPRLCLKVSHCDMPLDVPC